MVLAVYRLWAAAAGYIVLEISRGTVLMPTEANARSVGLAEITLAPDSRGDVPDAARLD